jgi:hypothetical protein
VTAAKRHSRVGATRCGLLTFQDTGSGDSLHAVERSSAKPARHSPVATYGQRRITPDQSGEIVLDHEHDRPLIDGVGRSLRRIDVTPQAPQKLALYKPEWR